MIKNQEMEISLGLPIAIEGFADQKLRFVKPFTLSQISFANAYLSIFDGYPLNEIFEDQIKTEALIKVLMLAFDVDESKIQLILSQISCEKFEDIMRDIKEVSGISSITDKDNKTTNKMDTVDWSTSINNIIIHTSLTYKDIQSMTLVQFNSLLEDINKNIQWNYKVSTAYVAKDENYITESDHPLSKKEKSKKMTTLEDLKEFLG